MLRGAARIVSLCALAACASDPPAAAKTPPYRADQPLAGPLELAIADRLLAQLAALTTADQMRAALEEGFTKRELQLRDLDAMTVAERIDVLVAAALDARRRPGDAQVHAHLVDSADRFVAARRDAAIDRSG